jgi:hypothetical protein
MKLKRIISACLNQFRTIFPGSHAHKPKRNYFRKSGQPCIPESLTECISETGITSIGDSYRRSHPDWRAEFASIVEAEGGTATSSWSFRKRRQLLIDRIGADFVQGDLVQVKGWILSHIEAEQCARLSAKPSR